MSAALYSEQDQTADDTNDNFKVVFKKLKRRRPPADLSDVIDFRLVKDNRVTRRHLLSLEKCHEDLLPANEWQVFNISGFPGFTFIVNPFRRGRQQRWTNRCLVDFTRMPNHRNLDAHMNLDEQDDVWKMYESGENQELMLRLRWATLGYHHNWSTKQYSEGNKSDIPGDLASLASHVALCLGYPDYRAQAAVVNYYNMDSTLSGHVDHSEIDQVSPLISFSFGQSAVFMFGGKTKEVVPVSFFIHSGDIVIMADQSRLCYHGVPKIVHSPSDVFELCCACERGQKDQSLCQDCLKAQTTCEGKECCKPCDVEWTGSERFETSVDSVTEYLRTHRINMNVRQVLPANQTTVVY